MLSDKLKKWLIANRAWEIYVFLQRLPGPEIDLISSLDEQIERAVFAGNLGLHMHWPSMNKNLSIREKYAFLQNRLQIDFYSYVLTEIDEQVIIRADSAPHHERDYRNKLLTNFPYHLHDEKERICSFSGNLEDFVELIVPYFRQK